MPKSPRASFKGQIAPCEVTTIKPVHSTKGQTVKLRYLHKTQACNLWPFEAWSSEILGKFYLKTRARCDLKACSCPFNQILKKINAPRALNYSSSRNGKSVRFKNPNFSFKTPPILRRMRFIGWTWRQCDRETPVCQYLMMCELRLKPVPRLNKFRRCIRFQTPALFFARLLNNANTAARRTRQCGTAIFSPEAGMLAT